MRHDRSTSFYGPWIMRRARRWCDSGAPLRDHPVALLHELRDELPVDFSVRPDADPYPTAVRRREKASIAGEDAGADRIDAHGDGGAAAGRLQRGETFLANVEDGMAVTDLLLSLG